MDKLYNKDSTYHKLSGNSYNPNIIKSRTTKIKNNDDSIQNFKIQASRVDKGNGCLSQCLKDAVYNGHIKKDPTYNIAINGTVKAKDVLLINSNLSKLPRRIDGKLFKLSHNAKKIV